MVTPPGMIADALGPWGEALAPPRLISHRENAVYEVALPRGRAALRLHRPGFRSREQVESELVWTERLAGTGFPCPPPLRTRSGALSHRLPDGQIVSVIGWLDGQPIAAPTQPPSETPAELAALYAEVGALLARLHTASDALRLPPGFTRPRWDRDGLTGPQPLWGRYWHMPLLTPSEAGEIIAARDRAREVLADFDAAADCGLIHSDALRENVFRTPNGLALLDFDDSGFGYRIYDLAACLTQMLDDAAYPTMVTALLDSYAAHRPLAPHARALFGMFAMLRSFSALGWTIPRMAPDHPRLRVHRDRALRLARAFMARS
jgi:Ser/Thr protein kinase RdoA (MazF antagonist)